MSDRAMLAKVDEVDERKLEALPTAEQLKAYYLAIRPLLVVVSNFSLVPAKYVNLLRGFLSIADKVIGV